jgi:hypothetical protein
LKYFQVPPIFDTKRGEPNFVEGTDDITGIELNTTSKGCKYVE